MQARVWTVRSLPNKIFLRAAGDGRSHLYCGTTGQVGVTTSNPKEPNTWFLHLMSRTAPVPPPITPRYESCVCAMWRVGGACGVVRVCVPCAVCAVCGVCGVGGAR
jgi:hypothetical protein